MGSIALTVLTLTLGMFFIFVGQFKVTPKFFPDIHEDMVGAHGTLASLTDRFRASVETRIRTGEQSLSPVRIHRLASVCEELSLGHRHRRTGLRKYSRSHPRLVSSRILVAPSTKLVVHLQVE